MCRLEFMLLIGDADDALRMGRRHVSKDSGILPFEQRNVVNTPDVRAWRTQRAQLSDAFLPQTHLAALVPTIEQAAEALVARWRHAPPQGLDVKDEMHHAALSIFIECMLGDACAFGGKPFAETSPHYLGRHYLGRHYLGQHYLGQR